MTWRILGRLKHLGLVGMTPQLIGGPNGGAAQPGYYLTAAGAKIARSIDPELRPLRRPAGRGTFLLRHAFAIAEVALAFRRAARGNPAHQVVEWECGWRGAIRPDGAAVLPDAHLVYATDAVRIEAFIEVDLGTEGTRFFAGKVSRYLDLYRGGAWAGQFLTWPLVLTVTPSAARTSALRAATESLLGSEPEPTGSWTRRSSTSAPSKTSSGRVGPSVLSGRWPGAPGCIAS